LRRFVSNDSAAIHRGDVGSAFQRRLDSPKGIVGVRKSSVDPGRKLCDRSAGNQTLDPPNRAFCFGEPSRDMGRRHMESAVGDQPLGALKRSLDVRQTLVDIGAERLEREELFGRSARNQTFDPPNRTFCFGEPSLDVGRQLMERTFGDQPLGAPKRFLDVRQAFVDIGAERLEREEFVGRSARNHGLDVPEHILCFSEPSGDASRQLMESTVGNEPVRAGKCFLNLSQPLFDAGGDGLKRCHGFDVRP
jgi:hypothetical protein